MAREYDYAALVRAVDGPPKPILIYQFTNRQFFLKPGEDPYAWAKTPPEGEGLRSGDRPTFGGDDG